MANERPQTLYGDKNEHMYIQKVISYHNQLNEVNKSLRFVQEYSVILKILK